MYKSKCSPEEKIVAVESYLRGEITQGQIAEKYSVHKSSVQGWIRAYKTFGEKGLYRKEHAQRLSNRQKAQAVEDYLGGDGSLEDVCIKHGIRSKRSLLCWLNDYNSHIEFKNHGEHGIHGKEVYMTTGKKTTLQERIEMVGYCIDHDKDYGAVVEKYGVSYSQIYSWVKRFKESGTKGLEDRRGKRRVPSEMSEIELLQAENALLKKQNRQIELENIVLKKAKDLERRGY